MPQYVAFLRGINLGKRRLKMDYLRQLFTDLDYRNVDTFIASGNVVFESTARNSERLEQQVERHLAAKLGYRVDTFIRTRAEVAAVVCYPAFPAAELGRGLTTVHVGFLKRALPANQAQLLAGCRTPVDEITVRGREFYWLCRVRSVESQVWTSPAMKAVKLPTATLRNLGMLRKLVDAFPAHSAQNSRSVIRPKP